MPETCTVGLDMFNILIACCGIPEALQDVFVSEVNCGFVVLALDL